MLILSLDTTTRAGSVAVVRDDEVLALQLGESSRTHGERLPGEIDAALVAASVDRQALDLLVVASGPGAFTGLRIGLAAIQGLAMTLAKPVISVSALDALAHTAFAAPRMPSAATIEYVAALMDAQRGEVYAALYEKTKPGFVFSSELPWRMVQAPIVGPAAQVISGWTMDRSGAIRWVGDGAVRFGTIIEAAGTNWSVDMDVPPLAPALAHIGRLRAAQGEAGSPHALQPLYVRRPDAELERARRTHVV
ncbi:MAG: tRNA (adenosine(37)-N6)-threonylcarbamoyltransferase complex dimerization subunit type 1 TsaB [Acidobacteria bacterium]|nr:tRNA (adenosine(37)-N6)-threonylcarbamoyltransferase complex dimerization subunit type 1 TsaB [Acidobacteriota bacterium]